jgi:uncharacterized protein
MAAIHNLDLLLSHLQPVLQPGYFAFLTLPLGSKLDASEILASIREPEGLSVVVSESYATDHALPVQFRAAWITLQVHSDLAAVGLTAAFSSALAQAGISCNVVAGVHHDHLFVPVDQAQQAMLSLQALQQAALNTNAIRHSD